MVMNQENVVVVEPEGTANQAYESNVVSEKASRENIANVFMNDRTKGVANEISFSPLGQTPQIPERPFGYRFIKRLFDIVFSSVVIVVGFVPCCFLAIKIALDTKASPIYTQERVGMGGKKFKIYKFRTMVKDSNNVQKYFNEKQMEEWIKERKVTDDPRIVEFWLREHSLDELPNFLNVFLGHMSVVGPRAIVEEEINWFGNDRDLLLSCPCGITGYWQIVARNDATFESGERQALELYYATHAGYRIDMKIILSTCGVMFGKSRTGQ